MNRSCSGSGLAARDAVWDPFASGGLLGTRDPGLSSGGAGRAIGASIEASGCSFRFCDCRFLIASCAGPARQTYGPEIIFFL